MYSCPLSSETKKIEERTPFPIFSEGRGWEYTGQGPEGDHGTENVHSELPNSKPHQCNKWWKFTGLRDPEIASPPPPSLPSSPPPPPPQKKKKVWVKRIIAVVFKLFTSTGEAFQLNYYRVFVFHIPVSGKRQPCGNSPEMTHRSY